MTITVLDADGEEVEVELPPAPGAAAAAASRSVALSTEDVARVGIVTETAPASDTASSGLNGRLQRIAQRLTTLLPVGSAAAAASLGVTASTEDIARAGIVTETAPASDTASSGLNGRLQRIAQRLTTLLPVGSVAAASSLGVTASTEDIARTGIITETAPGTDTASSGLNGRLQRVAQNLTTLIAKFTLGAGSAAAALRVTKASDSPDIALFGAVTETAPATDTASSGLNGRLQRIAQLLTSTLSGGKSASVTFTPAAASHTAGDCVGAAGEFTLMGPSGTEVLITGASLEIDSASAQVTAWRLHLYNVTPTSALADDAVWNYADTDRSQYLGFVDLPSTATDIGSNQWVEVNGLAKPVKLAGTSIFAYLVNLTTLTTAAVAHKATLHTVPV